MEREFVQRLIIYAAHWIAGNFALVSYLPQGFDLLLGRLYPLVVALSRATDRILLDDSFSPLHFHQIPFWLREKQSLKRLACPLQLYN